MLKPEVSPALPLTRCVKIQVIFRAESNFHSLLVNEEWAALVEIPLWGALGVRAGGGWISSFPEQAASVSMLILQGVFP